MSPDLSRTSVLGLLAYLFLAHHCLRSSHQQPALPLGCQHKEPKLLLELGPKCGRSHGQPQGSLHTPPQATRASTLLRYLARGAAWAPPGPQAASFALCQPGLTLLCGCAL